MMTDKPWTANGPEDRLSIAVDRFLRRTLVPRFWCSAIHDQDGGQRSEIQRMRDVNRGIHKGQLDWDVIQGPPYLHRKLELKRGTNDLTDAQEATASDLSACGGAPVVAWTLLDVWTGLALVGFEFLPNTKTVFQHLEAELAAWDREAELIKSGVVVKKRSTRKPKAKASPSRIRKAERIRAGGVVRI